MNGRMRFFSNFAAIFLIYFMTKIGNWTILWICVCMLVLPPLSQGVWSQTVSSINRQQQFDNAIPAGNYSGITYIGENQYAIVSDKSPHDGFYIFRIDIDSITGLVKSVSNEGFFGAGLSNRDAEGVAYLPNRNSFLVVGEADNRIVEYDMDGQLTGRSLMLEEGGSNYGYESLAYDIKSRHIWTCTENVLQRDAAFADSLWKAPVLRLQCFTDSLTPVAQYAYIMDAPPNKKRAMFYAHGVSELQAWNENTLLVLEREFFVPNKKLGASVICKLYSVKLSDENRISPTETFNENIYPLPKSLVCKCTTKLTLFDFSIANYDGMCLGPRLADGRKVIVLMADSQNRKAGILHDWFKTIVLD